MRDRATALAVALALALAMAACGGGAEKNVVNQYFGALKAGDTGTLTSFAMVQFDQPVQDYSITGSAPEAKVPAPLPELVKKQTDLEAQQKANERAYRAWGNDLAIYPKLDELQGGALQGRQGPAGAGLLRREVRHLPGEGPRAEEGGHRRQGRGRAREAQRRTLGRRTSRISSP